MFALSSTDFTHPLSAAQIEDVTLISKSHRLKWVIKKAIKQILLVELVVE